MMTQRDALDILKTGANVFLTGEPGSGKTYVVNAYVQYLREHRIEPSITASTGIAATHVGGMTLHAWCGIGIRTDLTRYDLDQIAQNKRVYERVSDARVLIIDEVSMLSATTLSMADAVCREIRRIQSPFGGLQVVLVGDFFQLPPVVRADASTQLGRGGQFAFQSPSWISLNPLVCYLSEQHRQEDLQFLQVLSAIRTGRFGDMHRDLLRMRYSKEPIAGVTQLYAHNADVDRTNDTALDALPGRVATFNMTSRGPANRVESLKKGCLSPESLRLKEGARVMFTKNDVMGRYVNGTLGTVVGFERGSGYPQVRTHAGRIVVAALEEWTMQDGGVVLARITQVPLRLAWAITVHKSQGMSLDAAHMDLSQVFEYGQGYVALSRVRELRGLTLAGLNNRATEVHPDVAKRDAVFRSQSERARETFVTMPPQELARLHEHFIRACGGSVATVHPQVLSATKKTHTPKKGDTLETTKALLSEGKTVSQIAKARKLTEGTIIGHLEQLYMRDDVSRETLVAAAKGRERDVERAQAAWQEVGEGPMTPVFKKLGGKVSYDIIRLARVLMDA
jgi:LysM repeat protein